MLGNWRVSKRSPCTSGHLAGKKKAFFFFFKSFNTSSLALFFLFILFRKTNSLPPSPPPKKTQSIDQLKHLCIFCLPRTSKAIEIARVSPPKKKPLMFLLSWAAHRRVRAPKHALLPGRVRQTYRWASMAVVGCFYLSTVVHMYRYEYILVPCFPAFHPNAT